MSHARVAIALLLAGACRRAEAPPKPEAEVVAAPAPAPLTGEARKWTWTVSSQDGRASVSQRFLGPGQCRVESSGATPAWSVEECRGDSLQLHFVSPDGRRLLVLDAMPQAQESWRVAPVAWLYEGGALVSSTNAGAFVTDEKKLMRVGSRFAWLAGTNGLPGVAPAYAAAGFVDGTTVAGNAIHVGFDGTGIPAPVAAPRPAAAVELPECDGMMEWTDAQHQTHYTDNAASVPARFRKAIRCTSGGDIAVVHGPKLKSPPPSPTFGHPPPAAGEEPATAAKGATVYCVFDYEKVVRKSTKDITVVGNTSVMMKDSYCTSGSVSDATRRCNRKAQAEHAGAGPCSCTDDATYISTRCD